MTRRLTTLLLCAGLSLSLACGEDDDGTKTNATKTNTGMNTAQTNTSTNTATGGTSSTVTPTNAAKGDAANGQKLFFDEVKPASGTGLGCKGCHGSELDVMGPVAPRALSETAADTAYVTSAIKEGVKKDGNPTAMRAFGGDLSDQELLDIVAYIQTAAK